MLEKTDNRRQRGNRLGGIEFQLGEHGTAQATSKEAGLRDPRAPRGRGRKVSPGMKIERFFTRPGDDGFRGVEWDLRTAAIIGEGGKMVFEQRDVEVPKAWSQTATNVVVQKYFRGQTRHARARAFGASAHLPGGRHHHRLGHEGRLLRGPGIGGQLPRRAAPPAGRAEDVLQLAGLVQRRHRGRAAVLGLLHQHGRGHHGVHPRPGQDRGHALQVRLGHRHQPVAPALVEGAAGRAAAPPRARSAS